MLEISVVTGGKLKYTVQSKSGSVDQSSEWWAGAKFSLHLNEALLIVVCTLCAHLANQNPQQKHNFSGLKTDNNHDKTMQVVGLHPFMRN